MQNDSTPAVLGLSEGLGPTPPLPARLRAASIGYDEWRVQDPKDGAYCMAYSWPDTSNPEREAREWLAEHRARGYRFSHYEVKCVRVQTEADKLRLDAADEIERLCAALGAIHWRVARSDTAFDDIAAAVLAEVCEQAYPELRGLGPNARVQPP